MKSTLRVLSLALIHIGLSSLSTPVSAQETFSSAQAKHETHGDPWRAIDGDPSTAYHSGGRNDWDRDQQMWITGVLEAPTRLASVIVHWYPVGSGKFVRVHGSLNNRDFFPLTDGRAEVQPGAPTEVQFSVDREVRYVRLYYAGSDQGGHGFDLIEFQPVPDERSARTIASAPDMRERQIHGQRRSETRPQSVDRRTSDTPPLRSRRCRSVPGSPGLLLPIGSTVSIRPPASQDEYWFCFRAISDVVTLNAFLDGADGFYPVINVYEASYPLRRTYGNGEASNGEATFAPRELYAGSMYWVRIELTSGSPSPDSVSVFLREGNLHNSRVFSD